MNCPNCNEILVMSERQSVEIDYCPKCRGVWLDKGELDKIIEKSAEYESRDSRDSSNNPGYDNDYSDKRSYNQRGKKKGFMGDMFDFD